MSGLVPLGNAATSVSSRFNLVGLVPSALLATAIGALAASGAFSRVPSLHLLLVRFGEVNVFIASVIFLLVFSVALVLQPFQLLLVQILEGYWEDVPFLRRVQFIGIEINRRRCWEINVIKDRPDVAFSLYPPQSEDLLPTRLGNTLRSAERRAGQKHGFGDAVEMLPRIYPYISSSLAENIGDARDDLDTACRMCAVLWTIALVAGCALTADGTVTRRPARGWPSRSWLRFPLSFRTEPRSAALNNTARYSIWSLTCTARISSGLLATYRQTIRARKNS